MKRWIVRLFVLATMVLSLTACEKDIQIFEVKEPDYVVQVSVGEMKRDIFYVKDGTKFAKIYQPNGTGQGRVQRLVTGRVLYFLGDEDMLPTHYKGENIVYKSASLDLKEDGISMERYKDMGYSIGIFGGKVKEDGYYHMTISTNCAEGSNAQQIFQKSQVDDIRVVSIGGQSPSSIVDQQSGIITGLEKGKKYTVEFYVGTYYYTQDFTADTHFLKSYEYFYYSGNAIEDTKLTYMAFATPTDLKSGYYDINGNGLMLYYDKKKGEPLEDIDMNVPYYANERDQILEYTRQYNLNIPKETKDLQVNISYGTVINKYDNAEDIGGFLISPEGTVYELKVNEKLNLLTITLNQAMQGDWTIGIYPRSLTINKIDTASASTTEETVCEELEMQVDEPLEYQAIYADITGDGDVYGNIIAEDGRTYMMDVVEQRLSNNRKKRYMVYRFPYLAPGTYQIKIYHYKSETTIDNLQVLEYDPDTNQFIIN